MVMPLTFEDTIHRSIYSAIADEIERQREKVIKEAVEEFDRNIRKTIANAVISVSDYYSIQMLGPELVIHVKLVKP